VTRQSSMNPDSEIAPQQPPTESEESVAEDDDEEARLLAELEAERQAEEQARRKRQQLEDRLASARGKKMQRSTSALPERGGSESGLTSPTTMTPAAIPTTRDSMSIH